MHRFLPQSTQFLSDGFTMFETAAITGYFDNITEMYQPVKDGCL